MYSAASGWLMTSLDSDPLMVALVQAASSLPICLFAIPANAWNAIEALARLIGAVPRLVGAAT
jgi:hypothetical protein